MRGLRERLGASERCAEGLKGELCALVAQRDQGQTELHQARLQAAQLTLQLADASLALREARAHWAQERQSLQCSTEVMTRIIVWMDFNHINWITQVVKAFHNDSDCRRQPLQNSH